MRVLCTVIGSASHARSLLPLARALSAAGHEVMVAIGPTLPPLARELATAGHDVQKALVSEVTRVFGADAGIRLVPCAPKLETDSEPEPEPGGGRSPAAGTTAGGVGHLAASITGPMAIESLAALAPLADDFRPDLLIRDGFDAGACLLAELRGLPHIPPPGGTVNIIDPTDLLAGLNRRREELGLPVQRDPLSILPYGRIDYMPPAYSFAPRLPAARAYRQAQTLDRGARLPEWVTRLPTDRPLVFAALGTSLAMHHAVSAAATELRFGVADPARTLRAIIEGLSRVECVAIVATTGVPVEGTVSPPHVHLTERLPQPLLLEGADLLITHGGYNSIREAVRTATAMAVLPQFADQPHNAQRVHQLRLGRTIAEPTPRAIAATCREVLADPGIAAQVRRAQRETLVLPEVDQAVADLETLVG